MAGKRKQATKEAPPPGQSVCRTCKRGDVTLYRVSSKAIVPKRRQYVCAADRKRPRLKKERAKGNYAETPIEERMK
jgi:hypothetical protein